MVVSFFYVDRTIQQARSKNRKLSMTRSGFLVVSVTFLAATVELEFALYRVDSLRRDRAMQVGIANSHSRKLTKGLAATCNSHRLGTTKPSAFIFIQVSEEKSKQNGQEG